MMQNTSGQSDSSLHIDLEDVDDFHDFDPELDGTLHMLPSMGPNHQITGCDELLFHTPLSYSMTISSRASCSSKTGSEDLQCELIRLADVSASSSNSVIQDQTHFTIDNSMLMSNKCSWSACEIETFEACLSKFGKDFPKMARCMQFSKTTSDIIEFYYLWKRANVSKYQSYKLHKKKPKKSKLSDATILEFHGVTCEVCGIGGKLMCCDTCPRCCHKDCANPAFATEPFDCWSCPACTDRMLDVADKQKAALCVQKHVKKLDTFNINWRSLAVGDVQECITLCKTSANLHSLPTRYINYNMEALVKYRMELKVVNRRLQRLMILGSVDECNRAVQYHSNDLQRIWRHRGDNRVSSSSRAHKSSMMGFSYSEQSCNSTEVPHLQYIRSGTVFSMKNIAGYENMKGDIFDADGYMDDDYGAMSEEFEDGDDELSDDDYVGSRRLASRSRLPRAEASYCNSTELLPEQVIKFNRRMEFITSRANPRERVQWNCRENLALCIGAKKHGLDWRTIFLDDDLFDVMSSRNIHAQRGRWRTLLVGMDRYTEKQDLDLTEVINDLITKLAQSQCAYSAADVWIPFDPIQGWTRQASYLLILSAQRTCLNFDLMFQDRELMDAVRSCSVSDLKKQYEAIKSVHEVFCFLMWKAHLKLGSISRFPSLTTQLLNPVDVLRISKKFDFSSRSETTSGRLSPSGLKIEESWVALIHCSLSSDQLDAIVVKAISPLLPANTSLANWKASKDCIAAASVFFGQCESNRQSVSGSSNSNVLFPTAEKVMRQFNIRTIVQNHVVDYLASFNHSTADHSSSAFMQDYWVLYYVLGLLLPVDSSFNREKECKLGYSVVHSDISVGTLGGKRPAYSLGALQAEEVQEDETVASRHEMKEEVAEEKERKNPRSFAFTPEETTALLEAVKKHGPGHWNAMVNDPDFKESLQKRNASSLKSRYKYMSNQQMLDENFNLLPKSGSNLRSQRRHDNDDEDAASDNKKRKRTQKPSSSMSYLSSFMIKKDNEQVTAETEPVYLSTSGSSHLVGSSDSRSVAVQSLLSNSTMVYLKASTDQDQFPSFRNTMKSLEAECKMIEVESMMLRSIAQKTNPSVLIEDAPQIVPKSMDQDKPRQQRRTKSATAPTHSPTVISTLPTDAQSPSEDRAKIDAGNAVRVMEYQRMSTAVVEKKKPKQRAALLNLPPTAMVTRKKVLPKFEEDISD